MFGGWLASLLLFLRLRGVSGRPPNPGAGYLAPGVRGDGATTGATIVIVLVRAFMLAALTTYLPVFLTEEGSALWFAGVSLAILEAAGVVGALAGGSLTSDRFGRRASLFLSLLVTPLLMFAFVVVQGRARFPLLSAPGTDRPLPSCRFIMALVQESFPENRALANGTYMALSFVLRSGVVVVLGSDGRYLGNSPGLHRERHCPAGRIALCLPLCQINPAAAQGN